MSNSVELYTKLSRQKVEHILHAVKSLKVGVIGDGCLDLYWHADMTKSELSRETPHYTLPIHEEKASPGAAGNVTINLRALGCENVYLCTVFGNDWRGALLKDSLQQQGIDYVYSVTDEARWTPSYCKPIMHGLEGANQEAARIDFANHEPQSEQLTQKLLAHLDAMAEQVDIIGVTDQLKFGVVDSMIRERLTYWADRGKIVVVDSRDRIGLFESVIIKPNEIEALRTVNERDDASDRIDGLLGENWEDYVAAGVKLSMSSNSRCCMTLGDKGAVWIEDGRAVFIPTREVEPPIDIVGAGDCFTASFMLALGAGCSGAEAAAFAHLGAAVSVKKIGQVGSASPQEILDRYDQVSSIK